MAGKACGNCRADGHSRCSAVFEAQDGQVYCCCGIWLGTLRKKKHGVISALLLTAVISVLAVAPAASAMPHPPSPGYARYHPWFGMFESRPLVTRSLDPGVVLEYFALGSAPAVAVAQARKLHREGKVLLAVLDPYGEMTPGWTDHPPTSAEIPFPLAALAAGKLDMFVQPWAQALASLRFRVLLSWAHEMNGDWYAWDSPPCRYGLHGNSLLPPNSPGQTSPRTFVKAWRHVHGVFTRQGARNITWIWTINRLQPWHKGCPPSRRITRADWPGSRYVNWIGIDGYFTRPGYSFRTRLAATVRFVRTFTRKPMLLQETGAWPGRRQHAQLRSLARGVRRYHLIGWVYENRDGKLGLWTLTRREERFLGRLLRRAGFRRP